MKKIIIILFLIAFNQIFSFDMESKIDYKLKRDSSLQEAFDLLSEKSKNKVQFFFDNDVVLSKKMKLGLENTKYSGVLNLLLKLNALEKTRIDDNIYLLFPVSKYQQYRDLDERIITKTIFIYNQDTDSITQKIKEIYKDIIITSNKNLNSITIRSKATVINEISEMINITEIKSKNNIEKEYFLNYQDAQYSVEILSKYFNIEKYIVDSKYNSIYLKYHQNYQNKIEEMIKKLDKKPSQVNVEVIILDYNKRNTSDIGLEWSSNEPISENIFSDLSSMEYLVLPNKINFSKIKAQSEILASPQLRVLNQKTSTIIVGEQVPLATGKPSKGDSDEYVPNVEYKNVGIVLTCTPNIHNSTQEITLKLNLEVNSVGEKETTIYGDFYRIMTKNINTEIMLKDGEIVAFGGLISEEERKEIVSFPFLGDIPILGKIFEKTKKTPEKSEIIMLIRPTVIGEENNNLPLMNNYNNYQNRKNNQIGG